MSSPSPAELARSALRRIAELRLPPTPAHYEHHYYEAAGTARPSEPVPLDPAVVLRVDDIVARASTTTATLAGGLEEKGGELAASLEALVADPHGAGTLLQDIVGSTREMHATVQLSYAELMEARRSLDEIKQELVESRRLLGQDPLTGSGNRRAMNMVLEREIARARREGEPLAVAMIDIDHFKKINDTHGHAAGDAALVHLTRLAKAMLRGNDAFIRYGGEEFLLVLPETGLQGGVFAVERLQALMAKRPLVHDESVILMSISAGVALLRDGDAEAALLKRADEALYEAKRSGRNRVVAERPA